MLHYWKADYYPGVQYKVLYNCGKSLRINGKPIVIRIWRALKEIATDHLTVGLISEHLRGESE